jgi:hypothetical protein
MFIFCYDSLAFLHTRTQEGGRGGGDYIIKIDLIVIYFGEVHVIDVEPDKIGI